MIAARDGTEMTGIAAAYSLHMTLPGGSAPVAGVTWVAVLPTHRRRGILTAMMRHQLEGLHQSGGEAIAALFASEPIIYGRFGYGLASQEMRLTMQRGVNALRQPVPATGSLTPRLCEPAEVLPSLGSVYEIERRQRPGMLTRDDRWWQGDHVLPRATARRGIVAAYGGPVERGAASGVRALRGQARVDRGTASRHRPGPGALRRRSGSVCRNLAVPAGHRSHRHGGGSQPSSR